MEVLNKGWRETVFHKNFDKIVTNYTSKKFIILGALMHENKISIIALKIQKTIYGHKHRSRFAMELKNWLDNHWKTGIKFHNFVIFEGFCKAIAELAYFETRLNKQ